MRRLFPRRLDLPEWVREALGPGERVLASTRAADGTWLVGTHDSLSLVIRDEPGTASPAVTRLPWQQVHRSDWDRDRSTLRVERVEEYGAPVTAWSFVLDEPGRLLVLVRERVTASVVLQRRVNLRGKRGFSVIARRPPGGGEVTWAWEFDRGVDPADPAVAAAAEEALRAAQQEIGL